jgi:lipopolysaccharide export system protein LptA
MTSSSLPRALLLALAGLLAHGAAHAKTSDRDQPMELDADGQDCNVADANSKCVFTGNVVIRQGTLDVRASRAEVVRVNGDVSQVVLTGSQATMKQQMDDGTMMNARADRIVYEPSKQILTLTGNFKIESPQGSNSGQKMVYNMGTGQMQSGGDGTRVRTVIQPRTAAPAKPGSGG